MDTSKILSTTPLQQTEQISRIAETPNSDTSFSAFLQKSVSDVNHLLNAADQKQTEVAVGKVENLHEAMIAVEKADTAMKFLVQVRNKAIDAYHEIMRMQV